MQSRGGWSVNVPIGLAIGDVVTGVPISTQSGKHEQGYQAFRGVPCMGALNTRAVCQTQEYGYPTDRTVYYYYTSHIPPTLCSRHHISL